MTWTSRTRWRRRCLRPPAGLYGLTARRRKHAPLLPCLLRFNDRPDVQSPWQEQADYAPVIVAAAKGDPALTLSQLVRIAQLYQPCCHRLPPPVQPLLRSVRIHDIGPASPLIRYAID